MRISQTGIDLIKKWEQFKADPYKCSAGKWTIGYGHTATAHAGMPKITLKQADELLKSDIAIKEAEVKKHLKGINLSQNQYDAVISFCFNLGVGAFISSNAYDRMLLDENSKKIADSWITFRNAGGKYLRGLMKRRIDELALYYK